MSQETIKKLSEFHITSCREVSFSKRYKEFEVYLNQTVSGEGIGWRKLSCTLGKE